MAPNSPLHQLFGSINTAQFLEAHQEHEEFNGLQITVHTQTQEEYHYDSMRTQQVLYNQSVRVLRQPNHPFWRLHLINKHWILTEPVHAPSHNQGQPTDWLLAGSGKRGAAKKDNAQAQTEQTCVERKHLNLTRPTANNGDIETREVFVHIGPDTCFCSPSHHKLRSRPSLTKSHRKLSSAVHKYVLQTVDASASPKTT